MAGTDLDGATEPGDPSCQASDAGEFAARWNALTEDERNFVVRAIHEASEKATICRMLHDGRRYVPTYGG